jgi:hypothetical protein
VGRCARSAGVHSGDEAQRGCRVSFREGTQNEEEAITLHDVVWVFDGWDPAKDDPDQVGEIWCCGQHVVMRNSKIACDPCGTVVEQEGGNWRVARVKGMEVAQRNGCTRV